jgi:hypothetical protein
MGKVGGPDIPQLHQGGYPQLGSVERLAGTAAVAEKASISSAAGTLGFWPMSHRRSPAGKIGDTKSQPKDWQVQSPFISAYSECLGG